MPTPPDVDPPLPATGYVWRPSLAAAAAATWSAEWPWRHVVVYCDRCGVEAEGDMPIGEDGTGAIPALRALLATRGWRIDAAGDVCPGCVQAQAREAAPDPRFIANTVRVSTAALEAADVFRAARGRCAAATPEQREQVRADAARRRAEVRAATPRRPVTVQALTDALASAAGLDAADVEHLCQPWCECGAGPDGWEHCAHWYDERSSDRESR